MTSTRAAEQRGGKRTIQLLRRLNMQARRTRRSGSAEMVHDLRVAIRRFVQALRVFKSLLPAKEREKIRHKLKTVMARAGAVRDCDITLQLLAEQRHGSTSIQARCEAERKTAGHQLAKSLGRWLEGDPPPWTRKKPVTIDETADKVLPLVARECLSRGFAAAKGVSPKQLHRFRISAKKLRYTVELFASPGAHDDARNLSAWLDQIKTVQTLLGEVNDCETARRLVSRLGGGKRLDAQLRKEQEKRVKDFHRHWTENLAFQWKHHAQAQSS